MITCLLDSLLCRTKLPQVKLWAKTEHSRTSVIQWPSILAMARPVVHCDGQQGINNVCLLPWLIPCRAPASHIGAQSVWSNNTLQARPKDFRKTFFMLPFRAPASACIYESKDAADKSLQICLHFQGRNHMRPPAGSLPHIRHWDW